MDLAANFSSFGWIVTTNLLALLLLAGALSRAPWRALDSARCNAWMGATILVLLLWLSRTGYQAGLTYHLLGVALLTLLMGPSLSLIAGSLILLAMCIGAGGSPGALGINWLCCVAVPVAWTQIALRLTQRCLPPNLFVYLFLNAFICSGLSLTLASLGGLLVLGWSGVYSWVWLFGDAFPYYLLLSWSEAFTTGLVLSILIVYRPHWVSSFDDERYLNDKSEGF